MHTAMGLRGSHTSYGERTRWRLEQGTRTRRDTPVAGEKKKKKKNTVQIVFLKSKRNESLSNSRHLKAGWNNF